MRRRDAMGSISAGVLAGINGRISSAAVASLGAAAGLGSLLPFSRWATAAAAAGTEGAWSGLAPWPLIPIHAVLLSDGRLLTYGTDGSGRQTGYFIYDVWNPRGNAHLTLPNTTQTDIFCDAQIVLPQSGNVLHAGGDNWTGTSTTNTGNNNTNIFYPADNTLVRTGNNMNRPRWYASPTTLPDGRIYIQGGSGGQDYPEIREAGGTFRLLLGCGTGSVGWFYPRNRVAPNGLVFGYSDRSMYYVDPNASGGNGSFTPAGTMPPEAPSGNTSADAMYAPGKILRVGGGANVIDERGRKRDRAKSAALVIDINGPEPVLQWTSPMPLPLHWANATVIADGRVVVTGGSAVANELTGVNINALLWNPVTGGWSWGARSSRKIARLYHSFALLLPDGSVLSGGGGAPGPQTNLNVEIYHPPYLFTGSGAFADRPTITSSPGSITYGQGTFTVGVDSAAGVQRVTFVKTGSVTHSCNFEQRFMELPCTPRSSSPYTGDLSVQAPSSRASTPPGYYLLFVIDSQGVPSEASIVAVR